MAAVDPAAVEPEPDHDVAPETFDQRHALSRSRLGGAQRVPSCLWTNSNSLQLTTSGPMHVFMPQRLVCLDHLTGFTSALLR